MGWASDVTVLWDRTICNLSWRRHPELHRRIQRLLGFTWPRTHFTPVAVSTFWNWCLLNRILFFSMEATHLLCPGFCVFPVHILYELMSPWEADFIICSNLFQLCTRRRSGRRRKKHGTEERHNFSGYDAANFKVSRARRQQFFEGQISLRWLLTSWYYGWCRICIYIHINSGQWIHHSPETTVLSSFPCSSLQCLHKENTISPPALVGSQHYRI